MVRCLGERLKGRRLGSEQGLRKEWKLENFICIGESLHRKGRFDP